MAKETVLYQQGTFCVREYSMPTDHDERTMYNEQWRYPPPPIFVRGGGSPRNTMREEGAVPGLGWIVDDRSRAACSGMHQRTGCATCTR